jgi:hypothetical protein
MLVAVIILVGIIYLAIHFDIPARNPGTPGDPEIRQALQVLSITPPFSRYYTISVDRLFESQTLWKARLSESDFMKLVTARGMVPFNTADIDDSFMRQAPFWWTPKITTKTQAFATPGFSLNHDFRSEGWFALTIWDPEEGMIYMWIVDMT